MNSIASLVELRNTIEFLLLDYLGHTTLWIRGTVHLSRDTSKTKVLPARELKVITCSLLTLINKTRYLPLHFRCLCYATIPINDFVQPIQFVPTPWILQR